jgi:hypothetical protein
MDVVDLKVEWLGYLSGGARCVLNVSIVEIALAPFPTCKFSLLEW